MIKEMERWKEIDILVVKDGERWMDELFTEVREINRWIIKEGEGWIHNKMDGEG